MKRLHQFIIKSFLGPFFMTFFICVFILLMQFLWKYIDDLVGKGLEWRIVSELLLYAAFGLVPLAFPLAMLLASIMTFGNLGENYELVAMKASGISLFRIMRPLFVVAFILTSIAFYFSNNILPKTNLEFYALLWSVKQQKPEMVIKEGVFSNDMENYSIKVEHKGRNNNMLYDVMIYNHSRNDGNVNVTVSDSGKMEVIEGNKLMPAADSGKIKTPGGNKYMSITLYNGQTYSEVKEQQQGSIRRFPFRRESFKKEVINISMLDFEFNRSDEKLFSHGSRMMNIKQLANQGDSLFADYKIRLWRFMTSLNYTSDVIRQVSWLALPFDSLRVNPKINPDTIVDFDQMITSMSMFEKEDLYQRAIGNARNNSQMISQQIDEIYNRKKMVNNYAMEWHRKFTLSFACLIFFFIGAPLGAIIRKGGLGMPVVVSILMFIAYYILLITGEKFAREDAWSMSEGMWFSSFVFLPLGIWLTYKAATDSVIMNLESYELFFKKLANFSFFKKHKPE
ncbi:MAG: LptF/LptG family permease [Bacteroidota bacterium]|nr:LptF/LptG family permease [Bacteroidota bacterium]